MNCSSFFSSSNVLDNYGVFIDGDNMNPVYFETLHELVKKRGRIIMKRVYGDFTEPNLLPWKKTCLEYGIEGVIAWREKNNKNSSDIKMVTDIMDILYNYKHLNNFVIVTGDIDFKEICRKIISENKTVIGISCFEKSTSRNLRNYCSEFIILNTIENLKSSCGGTDLKPLPEILNNIKEILTFESRFINLGLLKTKLLNMDSCFNEINYGFKNFKEFMKSFEPIIKLIQDKSGNYLVSLNE
jgi:predicted nuclease of predicted toxin-antitoxin system